MSDLSSFTGPDGAPVAVSLTSVTAIEFPARCECAGRVLCEWADRAGRRVSVCVRCGGNR